MTTTTAREGQAAATQGAGERHGGIADTPLGRRLVILGAVIVGVGGLVFALPGLGDVRRAFDDVDPLALGVVAGLELCSVGAYVVAFRPTFCRSLPWGLSARIGLAEQGTNVLVPTGGAGGLALGAWALRRAGMSPERIARRSVSFFVLTSAVNFVTAILMGIALTLGILQTDLGAGYALLPAGAAVIVLGVVVVLGRVLPDQESAQEPGRDQGRLRRLALLSGGALGDGFREAGTLLLRGSPTLVLGAVGYMAFDAAALWASFQAIGADVDGQTFMMAYVVGQLGGLIPIPGGFGGTDGGLVGALALYGTPVAGATAAVLGYRLFQLLIPALLGAGSLVALRKEPGEISGPCD